MAGRRKIAPPDESENTVTGAVDLAGGMGAEHLPERIARYSAAKQRAVSMRDFLFGHAAGLRIRSRSYSGDCGQVDVVTERLADLAASVAGKLQDCGEYLHFRHYLQVNRVLLHAACFCKQHLVCPLCAIRRGSKALQAYLERYQLIIAEQPHLRPFLITLTVRNGENLEERVNHLQACFRRLQGRRREWNAGKRWAPYTEFAKVQGAVGSYEFKRGSGSGMWHPHIHMIALCSAAPDQSALREEWKEITGKIESATDASFMVDVRPLNMHAEPAQDFMEVFKYAVKFSSFTLEDNWHVAQVLKAARLMFSFGVFRGVKVPEKMTDEPLDSMPYVDYFYRYFHVAGFYSVSGVGVNDQVFSGSSFVGAPDFLLSSTL